MSLSGTIRMDCSEQTWWDRMWGHKKCKWDMSGGLLLNGQPLQMHPQAYTVTLSGGNLSESNMSNLSENEGSNVSGGLEGLHSKRRYFPPMPPLPKGKFMAGKSKIHKKSKKSGQKSKSKKLHRRSKSRARK